MRPRVGTPSLRRERKSGFFRWGRVEAPLLLVGFPSEAPFGLLGSCLPTSKTTEARLHLLAVPRRASLQLLEDARNSAGAELAVGEAGRGRSTAELEVQHGHAADLARSISAGEQELWRVGVSLSALGSTTLRADATRRELEARCRALGFRVRVPEFETASVSGTPDLVGRERKPAGFWHTLPTDAVAAFFPFVDETVAEPGGILAGLQLDDATPVLLNRWTETSHSWGLFGSTGAGKSFAAGLWSLRSRWLEPDLSLYFLDPMGELGGLASSLGGTRLTIGPREGNRLNPLDWLSNHRDGDVAAGQFSRILANLFPTLADDERALLDTALSRLYVDSRRSPTFTDLVGALDGTGAASERLRRFLDVFCTGSLSYLNGPTNVDLGRGPLAIDLAGIPDERLSFHLAYLLDAMWADVRHRPGPKLIVVDEAHRLARDPTTAEFLDLFVRSARHFNAGLLLVSQNPDDFLGSDAGRSTLRNLRASVLLRLGEVSSATREFYRLTPAEAEWLPRARLPREAGYAEGLLRLGADHHPIAVVATTDEFEFLTQAIRPESVGGAPEVAPR